MPNYTVVSLCDSLWLFLKALSRCRSVLSLKTDMFILKRTVVYTAYGQSVGTVVLIIDT
jgi:hypothetical protein